jgi:membrane-bound lytic murein transglycosylase D
MENVRARARAWRPLRGQEGRDASSTLRSAITVAALGLAAAAAFRTGIRREEVRHASAAVPAAAPFSVAASRALAPLPAEPEWDIANIDHERVTYWIGRLQTDRRPILEAALERRGRYGPLVMDALEKRRMPRDLLYLAMIESAFDPLAYSRAHASGLWQFIAETGKRYGLEVNDAVDERRDPLKSTDAALRYLSDLHERFGSWYLAAAAYNTGENRVGRIMREEKGRERGTDADFYEIYHRLPAQTRDYVPVMIAAARIAKNPAAYGFAVTPMEPHSSRDVLAAPATPLDRLALQNGTTVAAIRELNPQLKLARTRSDREMVVRVPAASVGAVAAD